jgi:hypothetical protein
VKNTFESQGKLNWQAGVASAQTSHAPDGWLSHANLSLTCMFDQMQKINPEAVAAGVAPGAWPEHLRSPAAAVPIEVNDSLPMDHDSQPVDSVSVEEGSAPANKFQRSLTGPLTLGLKHTKGKGKLNLSSQGSSQQPLPSPSPTRASAAGGSDDADGASWCEATQLLDDTATQPADKLALLKAKLPLNQLMSGTKLGRQERNVRHYLANNSLESQDLKLLRNYLKLAPRAPTLIAIMFVSVQAKCVCVEIYALGNVFPYLLVKVMNSKLCRWRLPSRSRPTMSLRCRITS